MSWPGPSEGSGEPCTTYRRERFVQHPAQGAETSIELAGGSVKGDSDLHGHHAREDRQAIRSPPLHLGHRA